MMHHVLVLMIFGWPALVKAAPAIATNLDNSVSSNEDNSLNEYSLPNFSELSSDVDVDQTVEQVEEILKANPSLPRLSKGEILFLLNNITTEDKLKHQQESQEGNKSNRSDDERSLMVVLPFKAGDNASKDVSELYTKPPIIRYITPKPVVVKEEDLENSVSDLSDENSKIETSFTNHKYTDEETTKRNQNSVQNDFWQNQAQKVMNDLKNQNDKNISKHKEIENKIIEETPFKKMPSFEIPQELNQKNTSDNLDANSEPSDQQFVSMVLPNDEKDEPMDSLVPDDVKELLSSMGIFNGQVPEFYPIKIQEDSQTETINEMENIMQPSVLFSPPFESFTTHPDTSAYVSFKPLPLENEQGVIKNSDSLDEILQRYGLVGPGNSDYVPIPDISETGKTDDFIVNTDFIEPDMFPADMTSMLTEMGLTNKKSRKMSYLPSSEETVSTRNENKNSNLLNDNDANEYVLGTGPDPMSLEEVELMKDDAGSDMTKRQMFNESTTEPDAEFIKTGSKSGTKDSERISSDESNDENSNVAQSQSSSENSDTKQDVKDDVSKESVSSESPNLADLEDSFGASPADEDPSEAELPPPRKNGFYYMLDWNSFLEVGEGDTKVNIRFNPKLGDPQRFLPVTVP